MYSHTPNKNSRPGAGGERGMTREEQIEEMLPYMCHCCEMEAGFGECAEMRDAEKCMIAREAAEDLYDAGYRKIETKTE